MGYVFYYVLAHLACIFFLNIILMKIHKGVNKQASQVYLGKLVFILILYFISECFWALVDGNVISDSPNMLYFSNI